MLFCNLFVIIYRPRAEGLVTERALIVMRVSDGTITEVFEWVAGAHGNLVALDLRKRFEASYSYEIPSRDHRFRSRWSISSISGTSNKSCQKSGWSGFRR